MLAACKTLAITKGCPNNNGGHTSSYCCPLLAKMEEVFVVHYERYNCRDDPCDPIPDSFDAEVVGVFRQLCDAIECAREKVEELLPRFDYFAEDENEEEDHAGGSLHEKHRCRSPR